MSKIDEILIEDIETYLWSLDEKQQNVALSRWGFNHDSETLDEVGKRHSLSRERVRQLEKQINI
jgi:DNA-directed RNA polymerase sigma subunit (sigma70/sigma32)